MNIFKKIKLANKIIDTYKKVKELAESNYSKAEDLKKILDKLRVDFDELLAFIPALKELYNEVKEALK